MGAGGRPGLSLWSLAAVSRAHLVAAILGVRLQNVGDAADSLLVAGLATPYSQQTSFSIEHQIARDLTATASYLFVRGVKLPRTRNVNLLPAAPVFGPERADTRFDNIYQLEDSAS